MNMQMKRFFYILPAILLMVSCGGPNSRSLSGSLQMADCDTAVCASIEGQWLLEHVVAGDTLEVRPADVDPESKLYAHFYNDSTFNFQTGCNAIGGRYAQTGNAIVISDMMWTEMACEDMRVEELLRNVLPQVSTVDWSNDSILRLNSSSSAYIVLKKCEAKRKCIEPK